MFDYTPEDDTVATPPQGDPDKARIVRNVGKMRAQNATDDEVEAYLRDVEKLTPSTSGASETAAAPLSPLERKRRARERTNINEREMAQLDTPMGAVAKNLFQGVETTAGGLPGGKTAMAALRALGPETFPEAMRNVNQDVGDYSQENPKAAMALQVLGSAPTWGPTAAVGRALKGLAATPNVVRAIPTLAKYLPAVGIGAGTGAAYEALDTKAPEGATIGEKIANRAGDIAGAAGGGAALSVLAPRAMSFAPTRALIGAGAGAYLAPEGYGVPGAVAGGAAAVSPTTTARIASQALGTLANKVNAIPSVSADVSKAASTLSNVSEATGLRGKINARMQQMQDVLTPLKQTLGAKSDAAQNTIDIAKNFYERANELFTKAKADPRLLTNPALKQQLQDPDIAGAFRAVEGIRQAEGNPLSKVVTGQRTVESPNKLLDMYGAPTVSTTTEDILESVPDPSALHLVKRVVRDLLDGKESRNTTITLADAQRIAPKLQALTESLHKTAPDFARADAFYEAGKTAEEAAQKAYGAVKPAMQNPAASELTTSTPEAVGEFIKTRRTPRLQAVASGAAQRGAMNQLQTAAANAPLEQGVAGLMNQPAFAASGPAAAQRNLALRTSAPGFEDVLGAARANAAGDEPLMQKLGYMLRGKGGAVVRGMTPPNVLQSKAAQPYLADIVKNPTKYQTILGQSKQGQATLELLSHLLSGQVAR